MDAQTTFQTERASQYLASLCKHFGHKVPVQYDAETGQITLPFGRCDLRASEAGLALTALADNRSDLDRTVQVISSHLERFAFRENPDLDWRFPEAAASRG
ncbi:DUF2218 domain-containing protein [Hyphomonas sp.]|uniref:DUF2218 domain-containing protein n=1 Tax=Hyphomonas sp. TaxID=87 RepID=UPI003267CAA3